MQLGWVTAVPLDACFSRGHFYRKESMCNGKEETDGEVVERGRTSHALA